MSSVRDALQRYRLAPSRARGQNFLRSAETARRLVELSGLSEGDAAIEIGPGLGELTRPIAAVARRTVALEVDRGLVRALRDAELPDSVEVRHQDALSADLGGICRELGPPLVLLGNLPYRISGRLLVALLGPRNPFRRWAFMLQQEVADRVLASPGERAYGTLSVWAGLFSRPERVMELGPGEFVPRPRVRSSFVVFDPGPGVPELVDLPTLRKVVRNAFQYRRKTLRRALKGRLPEAEAALEAAGIDPMRRGETLEPEEFLALANAFAGRCGETRAPVAGS